MRAIINYINSLPRCHAEKTHGNMYKSGQPDVTACIGGRRVEIEVKRPGEHATPLQERCLQQWASAGAVTGVAHGVDEVRELFSAHGLIH